MEKINKCYFLFVLLLLTCSRPDSQNPAETNTYKIVGLSLTYILNHVQLPKEYYNQPLNIVQHPKFHIIDTLKVKGKVIVILPEHTDVRKLIKDMDIFKPIPIVEIVDINYSKQTILVDLVFRATGHAFLLKLHRQQNNEYAIIKMTESTI